MAIELHIFVPTARVPSTRAWQEAINQMGFPAVLDASVEVQTHSGFWPVSYKGNLAGFEFDLDSTKDLLETYPHIADQVGNRATCATFRWGGNLLEMCAALSAAVVLAKLTDGIFFYPDDDIIYGADEAVDVIRRDLSSIPT